MKKIAAFVLTHNEEKHIAQCLETLQWVDEIIIIDDYSQDRTVDIARTFGVKVYERELDSFSAQRNFALEQCNAEWVLVVDADERVTGQLASEIKSVVEQQTGAGAFRIPRQNHFLGRWVKGCGWYPDYSLRLFRRSGAKYEGAVHEHLHVQGDIKTLHNALKHYTYESIEQYVRKIDKYTTMAAGEMLQKGKRASMTDVVARPVFSFVKFYVLKRGFQEGIEGFLVSAFSCFYVLLKYAKLFYIARANRSQKDVDD